MVKRLAVFMYNISVCLNRSITINEEFLNMLIIFFEDYYDSNQKEINMLLGIKKKEEISKVLILVMWEFQEKFLEFLSSLVYDSRNMIKLLDEIKEENVIVIDNLVMLFLEYINIISDMNENIIKH